MIIPARFVVFGCADEDVFEGVSEQELREEKRALEIEIASGVYSAEEVELARDTIREIDARLKALQYA